MQCCVSYLISVSALIGATGFWDLSNGCNIVATGARTAIAVVQSAIGASKNHVCLSYKLNDSGTAS